MTQTAIRLDFVAMLADDCSTRPNAAASSLAAMKAAERATDPTKCRPGSPAVSNAYDEAARHWLSAAYVTVPPSTTTAERLLVAGILAARAEGRDLPIDRSTFQHAPAIAALQDYARAAPAIACGEGFWDDQDSACGDGMRQERSEAAELIRDALRALNLEAPAGVPVCHECFEPIGEEHHHQCNTGRAEEEAEHEEEEEEAAIVAERLAIGA
jgi:hypothetical protein